MKIPLVSIVAIYFVVWWICLFAVLPWGARSQREAGVVVEGSEPGAPAQFRAWPKILATTLLSAVITAVVIWLLGNDGLRAYLR
jgi:predicted secreted protein